MFVSVLIFQDSEPTVSQPPAPEVQPVPEAIERQGVPKLPAKFSHKWKNRATIPVDPPSVPTASQTQPLSKGEDI
jgi:hypothetical protein